MAKWNFDGDVNLTEGGYFWRHNNPSDDWVDIVDVVPESLIGGADNVFIIFVGSLYISPENLKIAFESFDATDEEKKTLQCKVMALIGYYGYDTDMTHYIRIGGVDPLSDETMVSEDELEVIRGNWKLKNYVKKHFLD